MMMHGFLMLSMGGPFYEAYVHSDVLGKLIFLSLFASSICCWSILIHKYMLTRKVKHQSLFFYKVFSKNKNAPLNIENDSAYTKNGPSPFYELYAVLKKNTIDLLNKNHRFGSEKQASYLSSSDIDCIASHLVSNIDSQTRMLENNLFILSTIVGLAPLLGLLGTVWGILMTFSSMQSHAVAATNQMMLGGISLALTTTVLGLLNAIPALIAYNYLKSSIRNFETEMEGFSNEMLTSVEMQYRKVDLHL